jgi:polyisoprenyl-phosphate glycosyltransferase
MTQDVDLSIIIPCYNEEKNIPLLINRYNECASTNIITELILVNNGSNDKTRDIIIDSGKSNPAIKLVDIITNIGYGNGIYQGLIKANGTFLSWTHADLQTDICDVYRAYSMIQEQKQPNHCYVKGTRSGRPIFDTIFTIGMSIFETLLFRSILTDINAQPNLFNRSLLPIIVDPPRDFAFDLYVYHSMCIHEIPVIRLPVVFSKRLHGVSHWNTGISSKMKFIRRTISYSLLLKKRQKNRV